MNNLILSKHEINIIDLIRLPVSASRNSKLIELCLNVNASNFDSKTQDLELAANFNHDEGDFDLNTSLAVEAHAQLKLLVQLQDMFYA